MDEISCRYNVILSCALPIPAAASTLDVQSQDNSTSLITILAIHTRTASSAVRVVGTSFISSRESGREHNVCEPSLVIEYNIGTLQCGIGVTCAILEGNDVTVGFSRRNVPLFPVTTVEVGAQCALRTVLILGGVVGMVDNVPVPAGIDPQRGIF